MAYIHTHSAEEIADKMPKDYYGGNKALYVQALKSTMSMFTPDGTMPAGALKTYSEFWRRSTPRSRASESI